jgi:hypothetical protein
MDNFSQSTIEYLTEAGWYAGRKVSLIKHRAYLEGEGYSWFPKVVNFLEEFGDLLIQFKRESGEIDTLNFDACEASANFDSYWVNKNYAKRIEQHSQFCVIGQAHGSHLLLFMNDEGKVYGGFDEFLCLIDISGEEAIEIICSNRSITEIPE